MTFIKGNKFGIKGCPVKKYQTIPVCIRVPVPIKETVIKQAKQTIEEWKVNNK